MKLYFQIRDETKGVREESRKFSFTVIIHMKENMFRLTRHSAKRSYCKSFSSPLDGPVSSYIAVFYQTTAKISNDSEILYHGTAKMRVSLEKPYVRTNYQILSKAREFIDNGMPPKQVYDQIN